MVHDSPTQYVEAQYIQLSQYLCMHELVILFNNGTEHPVHCASVLMAVQVRTAFP